MAITSNVSSFLTQVKQGVRPNMFQVDITFPGTVEADQTLVSYMCKSAALPASNIGVIEVPFRGRTVKIAGDRTFDNWSATFINDKEMKSRSYFEQWLNQINTHKANTGEIQDPTAYGRSVVIRQLEKDNSPAGSELRSYKLWYAFPISTSAIDLAYDSNDQIEEFSVEFQYSYWTVGDDSDTTAGDSGISIL
jgi:hypothetical protein|tara:strand:+ start:852 stop:1430 length:579 start_codon:yes stop_codon:yes gene_type:complete